MRQVIKILDYKQPRTVLSYATPERTDWTRSAIDCFAIVAILAILAGISIPALPHRHHQGYRTIQCARNLRQVFTAMRLYSTEHHNVLPSNLDQINHYMVKTGISKCFLCPESGGQIKGNRTEAENHASLAGTSSPDSSYVLDAPGINFDR